ncbi:MAG: hypothetical protein M1375_04655 [Candidatus Thermoplasmatota archaeon]|jgi:hypothetical protein|nr:hypothetical protein [Candidatus Thermoplasmatota archaeon]MCL5791243.1 hypothetical protein [Candidatus Thermoplasmatota archaeon]
MEIDSGIQDISGVSSALTLAKKLVFWRRGQFVGLGVVILGFAIFIYGLSQTKKVVVSESSPDYSCYSVSYYNLIQLHPFIFIPLLLFTITAGYIVILLGASHLRRIICEFAGKSLADMSRNEFRSSYIKLKEKYKSMKEDSTELS